MQIVTLKLLVEQLIARKIDFENVLQSNKDKNMQDLIQIATNKS
jgi:hypothetical protein